jgi:hypothetical protein
MWGTPPTVTLSCAAPRLSIWPARAKDLH